MSADAEPLEAVLGGEPIDDRADPLLIRADATTHLVDVRPRHRGDATEAASPRRATSRKRLARLEQRLEAAEHAHPARAGDARRRLRRAFEPIVHDREEAHAVLAGLDLP